MSRGTTSTDFANGNTRLSIIAEDENQAPPTLSKPKFIRTSNRSHHRRWSDQPPRHSFEAPPPKYDILDENSPPRRTGLSAWKTNRHIVKRGGWKRLLILILVLLAITIALAVGLGVGLTRNHDSSSLAAASATPSPSQAPAPFPIGSYAISTYLTSVLTSCTSNPATFTCYPYSTYSSSSSSSSADSSRAIFNWIISSPNNSAQNLQISTSQNPFANTFSSIPLSLVNAGQADEHYSFATSLQKVVVPNTSISPDGAATNCYYNTTTFSGALYTKVPASAAVPQSSSAPSSAAGMSSEGNGDWKPWPYAVNVTQSVQGGQGVPSCFEFNNRGDTGKEIGGLSPQPEETACECGWLNFDL